MRYRHRRPAADRFVPGPVEAVFARCDRRGLRILVLRDVDAITAARGGEVDLLIDRRDLGPVRDVFRAEGFVELSSWGHAPHHFFVRYEAAFDRWIKCDVVTEIVYGQRRSLPTRLADGCLDRRQQDHGVWVLSVEDELFTLLLHEMLDKETFRPHRIARLKQLRAAVAMPDRLAAHLARYWPAMSWTELADYIDRDAWSELLARRGELRRALRRATRPRPLARWQDLAVRWYGRLRGIVTPQAPSVSLLAPDGAGKSSLITDLSAHFFGTAFPVYMGLHQQRPAKRRRQVPGLGLLAALMRQWRRYISARYRQGGGQLVLFDRYTYDAWLPSPRRHGWWSRLRRAILARACPAPDLSVVLDAPAHVLLARKPERAAEVLEAQRQCYRSLQRRVPRVVIVDATLPLADVRRTVMTLVWERYRFGRHAPTTITIARG